MNDEKQKCSVNLCDTCKHEFATCAAKKTVWGIRKDRSARGAAADAVLECDQYANVQDEALVAGGAKS